MTSVPYPSEDLILNTHRVRVATILERKDGILQFMFDNDILIDVADIDEMIDISGRLTNGGKVPMIIVTGERNDTTAAARKRTNNKLKEEVYCSAEAVVITSMATRIAANFYYKIYAPAHPQKMFKTIGDAEKWIEDLGL